MATKTKTTTVYALSAGAETPKRMTIGSAKFEELLTTERKRARFAEGKRVRVRRRVEGETVTTFYWSPDYQKRWAERNAS